MSEANLRALAAQHGFSLHNVSYRLHGEEGVLEYRSVVRTLKPSNLERLAQTLSRDARVIDFRISPTSE